MYCSGLCMQNRCDFKSLNYKLVFACTLFYKTKTSFHLTSPTNLQKTDRVYVKTNNKLSFQVFFNVINYMILNYETNTCMMDWFLEDLKACLCISEIATRYGTPPRDTFGELYGF